MSKNALLVAGLLVFGLACAPRPASADAPAAPLAAAAAVTDPTTASFQRLGEAIRDGRQDGSIRGVAPALEVEVVLAYLAYRLGNKTLSTRLLNSLRSQITAQRGRRIGEDRADLLNQLITDTLLAMNDIQAG